MASLLDQYVLEFTTLRRNTTERLGDAPHKPILLLTILDCIERGILRENRFTITPELVASFHYWWRLLAADSPRESRIIYPFRHLASSRFWLLVKDGEIIANPSEKVGHPTSIGQLSNKVDYAHFAPDLWMLLQEPSARTILMSAILAKYFPSDVAADQPALPITDPLMLEAERLIEEAANARFRKKPLPRTDQESDVAYLRHYLFPRVVTGLYAHTCAVCRLDTRDDKGSVLVEAAHILPFARFHNDDPRNGITLCKNHHWGFDRGWFAVTDDYRVERSSRIAPEGNRYVEDKSPLLLPPDVRFIPAPEALAWHRKHVFRP